jgi:hypothetical protein
MISWTQFSNHVHRVLLEAFSEKGADPETIAQHLIRRLPVRVTLKVERMALRQLFDERRVSRVLHFTPIENVPKILRYGLIPRAHLEATAIRVVLNPRFTDSQRLEGSLQANSLSLSFPNYRMFYAKRRNMGGKWAVLALDPKSVIEFYCEFSPTNAARSGSDPQPGASGARRLFSGVELRRKLELASDKTTDPQAEILEDTVLPPRLVRDVFVENEHSRRWLASRAISATVMREYFGPRKDYEHWLNSPTFLGEDDYAEVLAYETEGYDKGRDAQWHADRSFFQSA